MLKSVISRWIHVSRIIDLVYSIVWEFVYLFGYFVDVEVVDYIAKGTLWVPDYILNLVIRFGNYFVHMWHEFIQLYGWMGICLRHRELDIKERELLISIDKDDLLPFQLWFLSGMIFQTSLWWFSTRFIFRWWWHGFNSGSRNVGRCQLLIYTPEFCSGWIPDKGCCK